MQEKINQDPDLLMQHVAQITIPATWVHHPIRKPAFFVVMRRAFKGKRLRVLQLKAPEV